MRNRREFLDEAIVLAQAGVVSLLTDGPVARPGHEATKDPFDDRNAVAEAAETHLHPVSTAQSATLDLSRGF